MTRLVALVALSLHLGCSSPSAPTDSGLADALADSIADAPREGVTALMDFTADLADRERWYDMPWPSDLRLTAAGGPDYQGFRVPASASLVRGVLEIASDRRGITALPVAYFRFDGPLAARRPDMVIAAEAGAAVMLLDVDPGSPERGRMIPTIAQTWSEDEYLPANILAVAAWPGFVLHPSRRYAFVVTRALLDASGGPVRAASSLRALQMGVAPAGARGAAAVQLYAPLWETLRARSIALDEVVSATVFTTGDAPRDLAALGDRVLARHAPQIERVALAPGDSRATSPRFCQLVATIRMPQFQRGLPPFNTEGTFSIGSDGLPVEVSYPTLPSYAQIPVVLTLPRRVMGAQGFPLVLYLHGSGGRSDSAVHRGTWRPRSAQHPCENADLDAWEGVEGCFTAGQGPAYVLAHRGFATAAQALPVNPERLPGASGLAYLNFGNLKAFRDTFRQGVLESRMFIRALSSLRIPASVVARCEGATLPAGVNEARFDLSRLVAQGQSMGGMYTNLLAATDAAVRAAIPTGAGGFWSYMVLRTQTVPGAARLIPVLVGTRSALTHLHPSLALLEMAWEPAEPLVFMPRLARDPLPSHPVRSIYEAVGEGDSYFDVGVYDAAALAFAHPQHGDAVWPSMQTSLALGGLGGIRALPIRDNLRGGESMTPYTGAVIQYAGDGVYDPHAIYTQLDAVKYQYGCFAQSFGCTGSATIPDPAGHAADDACEAVPSDCALR